MKEMYREELENELLEEHFEIVDLLRDHGLDEDQIERILIGEKGRTSIKLDFSVLAHIPEPGTTGKEIDGWLYNFIQQIHRLPTKRDLQKIIGCKDSSMHSAMINMLDLIYNGFAISMDSKWGPFARLVYSYPKTIVDEVRASVMRN